MNQLNQNQMDNSIFMMNQNNQMMGTQAQSNIYNSNFPNFSSQQVFNTPVANNLDVGMNNLDPLLLNGTNLDDTNFDDMGNSKLYKSKYSDNKGENSSLIKSLTKEIINNLKENNMSLYDNTSLNSRKSYSNKSQSKDNSCVDDNEYINSSSSKNKKSKSSKKNKIEETIEDFVIQNEESIESTAETEVSWSKWFFDECFNYKDFIIQIIL